MAENNEAVQTATETQDIVDMCTQRASMYRMFASLIDREVSKKTYASLAQLKDLAADETASDSERMSVRGLTTMAKSVQKFSQDVEDMLACDFARIFLASGQYTGKAAVTYESIYTSEEGILMQDARDEVRAEFRRAHVMPDHLDHIPEDYLPYEFEYMALLNDRLVEALNVGDATLAAGLADNQADFLKHHILNWVFGLLDDVDRMAETAFYHALAEAIRGFLGCEAEDVPALVSACALPVAC